MLIKFFLGITALSGLKTRFFWVIRSIFREFISSELQRIVRLPHSPMATSRYTRLTEEDYDKKLREMGNYLWELEQEADLASQREDEPAVVEREAQIQRIGKKAYAFAEQAGYHRALALYVAGLASRMMRQWETAVARFLDVLQITPSNGEAWLELTWSLAEMGKWEESEMAARKSTEFMPNSGVPWSNLAIALHRLGRAAEAEAAIKKALDLEPGDPRNQAILEMVRSKTESD
jgi:Flp pilus assembly protein TadD